jgi:hypothetical protein
MSKEKVPKPRILRRRKELNEIEQIQVPRSSPLAPLLPDATTFRSASRSKRPRPAATHWHSTSPTPRSKLQDMPLHAYSLSYRSHSKHKSP